MDMYEEINNVCHKHNRALIAMCTLDEDHIDIRSLTLGSNTKLEKQLENTLMRFARAVTKEHIEKLVKEEENV